MNTHHDFEAYMDIETMQASLSNVSVINGEPWYECLNVAYNTSDVPKTPKQAFEHPTKADKYMEATIEEIEKLMEENSYLEN